MTGGNLTDLVMTSVMSAGDTPMPYPGGGGQKAKKNLFKLALHPCHYFLFDTFLEKETQRVCEQTLLQSDGS